jgi:prepilin-type N-terminal cleavage/methylation domain-containing protein/prepilin-type processing-associated H-X9-DG protein
LVRTHLRSAFTLIELLVVISIIAILAGILFPVFARAKLQAYGTACINNENQDIKAFQMYADDFDSKPVLTFYPGTNSVDVADGCTHPGKSGEPAQACMAGDPGWPYLLNVYRKSYEVLRCPAAGDDYGIYAPSSAKAWWYYWSLYAQHGYNWVYICPTLTGTNAADTPPAGYQMPRKLSLFQAPSDTIVFLDTRVNVGTAQAPVWKRGYMVVDPYKGTYADNNGTVDRTPGGWSSVAPDPRHADGVNTALMDGHVKRFTYSYISNDARWDYVDN